MTEKIIPFFDPEKEQRQMNVVAFMSGSGTNVEKILEYQKSLKKGQGESPYRIVAIFSDTTLRKEGEKKGSRAKIIADEWNDDEETAEEDRIELIFHKDINEWYQDRGYSGKNDKNIPEDEKIMLRQMYDHETSGHLVGFESKHLVHDRWVDAIALAGYMSFLTEPILDYRPCINVHPADLRVTYTDQKTGKVRRKYTGDNAVRDAIAAGEPTIRSSVHIATAEVDYGPLLMISEPLKVEIYSEDGKINPERLTREQLVRYAPEELQKVAKHNQDRLKEKGDWVIFPKTLEMMARGMFGKDGEGKVYHKNTEGVWTPREIVLG